MTVPEVTVVVICFNDAARLPRAVASVQRQTLQGLEIVIVDDASTDDTEQVARAIAAADPRVRYERLPANSGGCSAPRNRGLELARAPWVMFCDSDDEYERHACKNLLLAAERTGADVVCGTAVRVDVRTGRAKRWRPELHERERTVDALADLPELLYDTISVDKIYRTALLRDAGVRFPEGILFEDQLFTLQAMSSAQRLTVIPQTVYRWYVDKLSDDPSITQRRAEVRNVESRIEVNRLIDAYLAERGLTELAEVKAEKFLRHDLYLYLSSMVEADDETAGQLVDRLAPYVGQVPLEAAWRLRPALRVAIFHLLRRDVDGVRRAMRFLAWASAVDTTIAEVDGRDLWDGDLVAAGELGAVAGRTPADWLDVGELRLLRVPFAQRRPLHRIDEIEVGPDGSLRVRGRTRDYDGTLRADDTVELRATLPGGRAAVRLPLRWNEDAPDGRPGWWRWQGEGVPIAGVRAVLAVGDRGSVSVALERDGVVDVMAVRAERSSCPRVSVGFPGARSATGPDALAWEPGENGAVAWRATVADEGRRRRARGRDRRARRWRRLPGSARVTTFVELVRREWLRSAVVRLGWLLPPRRLLVLEERGGRGFGGDVAAIGRAVASSAPDVRQVWAYRDLPDDVPSAATGVERGSLRHAWTLARAGFVLGDGDGLPGPSRRAVVVDVGPGVPVRRLGLDDPSVLASRAATAAVRRSGRRRRTLLAASPAAAAVIGPALAHRRDPAAVGLPGLDDALTVRQAGSAVVASLRRELGLPADRAIVVHAPVRRAPGPAGPPVLLDAERWAAEVGDDAYLVVCSPVGMPIEVPTRLRWAVREVPSWADRSRFLAAADVVVADYGREVGDAALLDVPLVLLWPDRATFVDRAHGVYPGVTDAGPVAADTGELCAIVRTWLADPQAWDAEHGTRRRAWAATWCGPADGGSASRAAAVLRRGQHE